LRNSRLGRYKITGNFSYSLTPKEIEIINFIKQGKTVKEIADVLCLSTRTIETHRNNIRSKLGIKNKKVNLTTYLLSIK